MTSNSSLPRRRNGKQQACEPCRRRKLACDHTLPVCERCKKGQRVSQCIYITNPMSNASGIVDAAPTSIATPTSSTRETSAALQSQTNTKSPELDYEHRSSRNSVVNASSSFLGATSFSHVFLENQDALEESVDYDTDQHVFDLNDSSLDTELVSLGVRVLQRIPDKAICDLLLQKIKIMDHSDLTHTVSDSFWNIVDHKASSRSEDAMRTLSRRICHNSATVLRGNEDPQKWISSFTGMNLRWEALGLLLVHWSRGATDYVHSEFAVRFPSYPSRGHLCRSIKELATNCVTLTSRFLHANVITVDFLLWLNILETLVTGDTSLVMWRRHGDMCATVTSLGMHRDTDSSPNHISFMTEINRRTYHAANAMDKMISYFTGRPPLLHRQYSSTPLPLDISEADLLTSVDTLKNAVSKLDENGWDTSDNVSRSTGSRVRAARARLREEVLEVALGPPNDGLASRVIDLEARAIKNYNDLPEKVKYRRQDLYDNEMALEKVRTRLWNYVEHLMDLFTIERLCLSLSGQRTSQKLFDISGEVLSLTLSIWRNHDQRKVPDIDHGFIALYQGAPASGILCLGLLEHTKSSHSSPLTIRRSQTIRDLFAFVEFLSQITEPKANATLCLRIRDIISRVLDRVLNFVPPSTPAALDSRQQQRSDETQMGSTHMTQGTGAPLTVMPAFEDFRSLGMLDTWEWADFPLDKELTDATIDEMWARLDER